MLGAPCKHPGDPVHHHLPGDSHLSLKLRGRAHYGIYVAPSRKNRKSVTTWQDEALKELRTISGRTGISQQALIAEGYLITASVLWRGESLRRHRPRPSS